MRFLSACFVIAALSFQGVLAQAAALQPVDSVLARIGKPGVAKKVGPSDAAKLLLDINEFRGKSTQLSTDRAATDWLALWDRAQAIDPTRAAADYDAYDIAAQAPVGLRSVLAVLPAPEAWPAIRKAAVGRATKKPDDAAVLGLRLISELLVGDVPAARKSLSSYERLAMAGSPTARDIKRAAVDSARALVSKLYGSRLEIADGFRDGLDTQARLSYGHVDVPDLVGLIGASKAEALLVDVLRKPVSMQVVHGEATRALARRLALAGAAALRKPQWGLIDNVGHTSLYEAMQKRFESGAADSKEAVTEEGDAGMDYQRRRADLYYFLDLVIAGRHEEAERAMARASGGGLGVSVPKQAMAELIRAGKNQAVYAYLARLLERRPQLPAWDMYLEQAGYLGKAEDAITLLDTILKRADLAPYLRSELQTKRLDALLGADRIDEAAAGFRALLLTPPARDDAKVGERSAAALRFASLGRVLKQPAFAEVGLTFVRQAVALPTNLQRDWRPNVLRDLFAELRRQGRESDAQALAITELERETGDPRYAGFAAIVSEPTKRMALVELVGLYDAANRSADVLRMFNDVGVWGARDLRALTSEKDSLGTPVGLMAARALKANGDSAAARTSLLALLDQTPGYDPAYQLFVSLNPEQAIGELDRTAARDPFEERPLIWKAVSLNTGRQYDAAEATIRRAIAIDPSDGEQGPNDRLRAYAVLADILEAKGDPKSASVYRRAVVAIRVSERADEMHKLGLYQRAFADYRAALDEFSDAYCIQSRLAVQLAKRGLHEEALKHFRRAFELMPDSFGRVESHCFGCESVFAGPSAQAMAEQVFTSLAQRTAAKPQATYMLGYLRMEQGRYEEALGLFRQVVALDPEYLNAWKHLHELGQKTYIEPSERDIARLKLFELDPRQLHVRYQLDEVANQPTLWRALARFEAERANRPKADKVYPLAESARERDEALARLPADMRSQLERYVALQDKMNGQGGQRGLTPTFADHALLLAVLQLMGDRGRGDLDD